LTQDVSESAGYRAEDFPNALKKLTRINEQSLESSPCEMAIRSQRLGNATLAHDHKG